MDPQQALRELSSFGEFKQILLVGHEPDFSRLIEWVVGASGGSVEMKKGAVACLQVTPPARHGTLVFLIPPKLTGEPGA
jgi:phosphohistidine phosphatase SixA